MTDVTHPPAATSRNSGANLVRRLGQQAQLYWRSIIIIIPYVWLLVFFLLPFAGRGARLAVNDIKNNVADWLPSDYPETKDLGVPREADWSLTKNPCPPSDRAKSGERAATVIANVGTKAQEPNFVNHPNPNERLCDS